MTKQTLVVRLRLRDRHAAELNRQARAVNLVWNYCNEAQRHVLRWDRWLSGFDLQRLTAGSSKELGLHSSTIGRVCERYGQCRINARAKSLRFRGSRSLGWVPFSTARVSFDGEAFVFHGRRFEPMHLRDLLTPGIKIGAGSFNRDAAGRWYINVPIEIETAASAPNSRVGLDLGVKNLATLSCGDRIELPRFYREAESKLAAAQRARKPIKRIRRIHTKIANRRKDFLHKVSTALTSQYGLIVVGDVSPSKLAKTPLAKSVLDAGWSGFRHMLSYKAITRGGMCLEVPEANTTQVCSECGCFPASRPKGIAGLRIREWTCDCGAVHDRDVNAARNILRVGLHTLAEGAAPMRSSRKRQELRREALREKP